MVKTAFLNSLYEFLVEQKTFEWYNPEFIGILEGEFINSRRMDKPFSLVIVGTDSTLYKLVGWEELFFKGLEQAPIQAKSTSRYGNNMFGAITYDKDIGMAKRCAAALIEAGKKAVSPIPIDIYSGLIVYLETMANSPDQLVNMAFAQYARAKETKKIICTPYDVDRWTIE